MLWKSKRSCKPHPVCSVGCHPCDTTLQPKWVAIKPLVGRPCFFNLTPHKTGSCGVVLSWRAINRLAFWTKSGKIQCWLLTMLLERAFSSCWSVWIDFVAAHACVEILMLPQLTNQPLGQERTTRPDDCFLIKQKVFRERSFTAQLAWQYNLVAATTCDGSSHRCLQVCGLTLLARFELPVKKLKFFPQKFKTLFVATTGSLGLGGKWVFWPMFYVFVVRKILGGLLLKAKLKADRIIEPTNRWIEVISGVF